MSCQAILINYHGAELIRDAAASLADDPACTDIVVVNNSVCPHQQQQLRATLPARVRLLVAPENLGFARACNLAFAGAQRRSDAASAADRQHKAATATGVAAETETETETETEFVLLLNPDARLLPGALARLIRTLHEHPHAAAVGPRIYWDHDRRFLLPLSTYPSARDHLAEQLAACSPRLAAWRSHHFRRQQLHAWTASRPFPVHALSGGHILLRRSAVQAAGGLFDPRFFMYFEDSDLMHRLHRLRRPLLLEPRARAIHLYDHTPRKNQLLAQGWHTYRQKHFTAPGWRLLERLIAACPHRPRAWPPLTVMQPPPLDSAALSLPVPDSLHTGWLLEIGLSPHFVPAIGHFGSGPRAHIPAHLLQRFSTVSCYLRLSAQHPHARPHLPIVHIPQRV